MAVVVLPLHGHLAPAAWAAAQAAAAAAPQPATHGPDRDAGTFRVGYVQTAGGALPGSMSRDVAALRERGLLAGHITAAPSYGGEHEALSTVGALDAARRLGWDAALVGPGPGIIGSGTELGHGGMAALDSAHAALALGLPTLLSPRLSSSDPRERHRGLSHHTQTVLELLLAPVAIATPSSNESIASEFEQMAAELRRAAGDRHQLLESPVDLRAYESSGLPTTTMGRSLADDPHFFSAPLAAGTILPRVASQGGPPPRKL
jgi:hypothetical protein